MASKVDSIMSTSIALETLKASNSINSLTKAVRGSTSAWKAQEAQLKSSGDYLKASEAKYEGLGKSIEAERKRIEVLQEKMKDLDQTTQDGAKQAVKYGTDLDKATAALKSMEAQQQRAHEALKREKSGINSLNSSMRQRNSLSKAISDRLEAEGKHEQALKEKRDNARKSIDDISRALKKEEALLKDLENNNGSASAINKQRIAVEKLKTSMLESKSSVSRFDKSIKELNPSPIQRLRKSFGGLRKEGKETHSIFKSVFAANIVSNAFTSALGTVSMKLHDMWSKSMDYAKAQQTMNASWLTLTGNAKEGQKMVNMTNDMAASFANSTDMVNDLNQKFYSISNSSKTTKQLTTDVLTLQDAFGKSDDAVKNFSTQYSQMMANGKVSAQDMMSFVNVFPKIRTELLKTEQKISGNHDLSMKQLNDMISNGEVSSKTMQKVMDSMQKKYSSATANFGKTFDGMNRTINARVPVLLSAFTTPLLKMRNPFLGAISKWVSDKNTEKQFSKLGGVASREFGTITNVITKHAKQIVGFFKGLWSSIKIIGSIGAGFFSGLISGLGAVVKPLTKMTGHSKAVKGLSGALGELSKHKKGLQILGKALAGIFITSKALKFASAMTKVGEGVGLLKKSYTPLQLFGKGLNFVKSSFVKLKAAMIANPFIALAVAIIGVSIALVALYKHNKKFRNFVNGIAKAVANFTKNTLKAIKKFFSNIGKGFSSFGKSFKKSWNNTWNSVKKFFSNIFNGIHKLFTSWGKAISKYWNSFSKLFKKAWNSYWDFIHDFYAGIFKKVAKVFRSWTGAISKTWNGFKNWFGKKWSNMWNGVHDFFHGITKKLSKTFSNWTSGAMNILGSFGDKFKSGWNGLVKGVKNIFSGLWDSMKEMASNGINAVIDIINKGIDGVDWVINKFGGKKKTIGDLSHVHFATGTGSLGSSNFRRAINSITPAIVNDEVGASNPELIFRKATGTVEYSKEKNAETVLFPGDEVANASDSAKLAPILGITHFAGGGIGDFFGGVINGAKSVFKKIAGGLKGLFDVGVKIISNPGKALESLMPFSKGLTKGFFPTIAKGGFDFVKKQAGKWWSTLWSMVDLNGGSGSYGGGWQSPGSGWTHTDGFGSPRGGGHVHDGNDFSASVGTAFHAMHGGTVIRVGNPPSGWGDVGYNIVTRDSTGKEIIYQEFGNAKDVRVHKGQHVKTGDTLGVLGHSGLGTGPHLHVGLTNGGSVWSRGGYSTRGWLDITKQHGKDKGSDTESSSGNSGLQQMIKKQVGGGFWNTIKKIASLFGDDGGSGTGDPGGAGVQRWRSDVKRALSKLGLSTSASMVSRVLRQINTESKGDPKIMGGTDGLADGHAMGLMQVKPGTFRAYHLPGHNNIWNGFDNMLAGLNYAKHRYGSGLSFLGNGHGYANGGIATTPSIFGEAGPEMAIPLSMTRSDRANQLLGETVVHMAKNNPDRITDQDTAHGSNGSNELITKLDKLTNLAANMVALLQEQILATRDGAFNKDALYRTQALDQNIADFQSF
ncbi:peptidoglycan DD-metalloendopeptidase family protein [Pediococcus acidilactici]|uniref:tape measure protein n=1 Tax=Pediococcus acidilactici TaxID=1254 RepID=UPI0013266997|nr:tape measure protein [Pediococcus acidilactici]KAF0470515.1 peptidoglycan DD-metalloendopeptidase family protein [Pediococcus acidilactici]KAF0542237.1 peptidoglycan DD-metalloendopeptidase family protein [Pediococcus acidilactici]